MALMAIFDSTLQSSLSRRVNNVNILKEHFVLGLRWWLNKISNSEVDCVSILSAYTSCKTLSQSQ